MQIAAGSDASTLLHEETAVVKPYFDSPRIHVLRSKSNRTGSQAGVDFVVDLLKNNIRAVAFPGQVPYAAIGFRVTRGISDTLVEQFALTPPEPGGPITAATGVATVFQHAEAQGISTRLITPGTRSQLEALDIEPQPRALINRALDAGKQVFTPSAMVAVDGGSRLAWIEVDPQTGETMGVFDDGTHGAFAEWAAIEANSGRSTEGQQFNFGVLAGVFGSVSLIAIAKFVTWVYIGAMVPDPSVDPGVYWRARLQE